MNCKVATIKEVVLHMSVTEANTLIEVMRMVHVREYSTAHNILRVLEKALDEEGKVC